MITKLKTWRKKHGVTQIELANWLGVSTPTVCKLEAGVVTSPLRLMDSIVKSAPAEHHYLLIDFVCRNTESVTINIAEVPPEERQALIRRLARLPKSYL